MRRVLTCLVALGFLASCEVSEDKAAFGESCEGPSDCESGICLTDSSGNFENFYYKFSFDDV